MMLNISNRQAAKRSVICDQVGIFHRLQDYRTHATGLDLQVTAIYS